MAAAGASACVPTSPLTEGDDAGVGDAFAGAARPVAHGYATFVMPNTPNSGLENPGVYVREADVVRDAVTGRVWQLNANEEFVSHADALAYCENLSLGETGPFRVPSRIELISLVDAGRTPSLPAEFGAIRADYYWTSSVAAELEDSVYTVYFGSGETTIADAAPGRALVRCVAGGDGQAASPWEVQAGTLYDPATHLEWERVSLPPSEWEAAQEQCAARDKRLPSIRELQTLVDEAGRAPALDETVLDWHSGLGYWSATARGDSVWYVDFFDGKSYADVSVTEKLPARCVRVRR